MQILWQRYKKKSKYANKSCICQFFFVPLRKFVSMKERLYTYRSMIAWLKVTGKGFRLQTWLNVAVGISHVLIGLLTIWLTKNVVDMATGNVPSAEGGWNLWTASIVLILMMIGQELLVYLSRWIRGLLGVRAKNRLQSQLYYHLISVEWSSLRKQHSGQMMSRLTQDVETVSNFISEKLPQLLAAMVQFCGAFVFLYKMDKRLALVVVIVIPILVLLAQAYMHRMRRYNHEVRDEESKIQAYIQENLQHTLILKTLELIDRSAGILRTHHTDLQRLVRRNTKYSAAAALIVNSSFVVGYLIAFFWGIHSLSIGVISFGAMIAFIQLVGQIQSPIRTMVSYVGIFISTSTATERLMEVDNMPIEEPMERIDVLTEPIRVDNITFGYDPEHPILKNWSATFEPGTVTAIVGHTGSGKTTLISLLLGLMKPQSGKISPVSRSLYSYVPQGNTLMSGSVRENLLMGNPKATDEEMWEVLRVTDAEFVFKHPKGLDMPCGERGIGLSEGQAQRIAISRSLLRKAPVLLFDEVFSALDSATAQKVFGNILRTYKSTILYITHREALMPKIKDGEKELMEGTNRERRIITI